jgi:hypothetical protein
MSSTVRWVVGALITALGAAALIASWRLEGEQEWLSSLLLDVGVVLFLLLPLLLFERLFERRVEQIERDTSAQVAGVREEVAAVRAALGELDDQTEARLAERREADEAAVRQARQDVSFENVIGLLDRANSLGAVSTSGARVPVRVLDPAQDTGLRIKFQQTRVTGLTGPERDEFSVSIVDVSGEPEIAGVAWQPNERGPEVIAALIDAWQGKGTYPGPGFLDADGIFEELITTLEKVIDRRRRGESLGPIIEQTSEHWALTELGMEHLADPRYVIEAPKIKNEPQQTREHMLEKRWVHEHEEEFRESFERAETYFQGQEAARRAAAPPF